MVKRTWLLFFLLISLPVIGMGSIAMTNKFGNDPQVPIRKAVIKVQEQNLDLFFDQMRHFADKNGFAIRIAPTAPTGKDFLVELWREDFKILAANPFDKGVFRVSIFNILGRDIEDRHVDDLVASLKKYSLKVDGAEFTEQPGSQP